MENVIEKMLNGVAEGKRFKVDFINKTALVGDEYLIKDGEFYCDGLDSTTEAEALTEIERLYKQYKYSKPSEKNDSRRHRYFKCLKADEMSDEELLMGSNRDLAQAELETYVLNMALNGTLEFGDRTWFWKSNNDNDLIILKEWITL